MRAYEADVNESQKVVNKNRVKQFYLRIWHFLFNEACCGKRIGKEYKIFLKARNFMLFFIAKKTETG